MGNSKLTNLDTILLLIIIWPIGLLLMWKHNIWSKNTRTLVTIFCVVLSLAVYSSINYKTVDKSLIDIGKLDLDEELDEEMILLDPLETTPIKKETNKKTE